MLLWQMNQNVWPCAQISFETVSPPAHGAEQSERTTPQLYSGFRSVRGRVYSHNTPGFFPWRRICEPRKQNVRKVSAVWVEFVLQPLFILGKNTDDRYQHLFSAAEGETNQQPSILTKDLQVNIRMQATNLM